mmetsp:Transcript_8128/g.17527  ORF Transcript_8128/g.17527 Transcript_8128/m.17527 type:complete len:290 (-) Transcript_8128:116-985(-)
MVREACGARKQVVGNPVFMQALDHVGIVEHAVVLLNITQRHQRPHRRKHICAGKIDFRHHRGRHLRAAPLRVLQIREPERSVTFKTRADERNAGKGRVVEAARFAARVHKGSTGHCHAVKSNRRARKVTERRPREIRVCVPERRNHRLWKQRFDQRRPDERRAPEIRAGEVCTRSVHILRQKRRNRHPRAVFKLRGSWGTRLRFNQGRHAYGHSHHGKGCGQSTRSIRATITNNHVSAPIPKIDLLFTSVLRTAAKLASRHDTEISPSNTLSTTARKFETSCNRNPNAV